MSTRYTIAKEVVEHGVYGRSGSDTPRVADGCVSLEGAVLDAMTARVLTLVYEAFKEESSREKFDRIPLERLVNFCWSKVSTG